MDDVECPYCEKYQEIDHDDGAGYEEDRLHSQTCRACDKIFTFTTSILYCYEAYKADCLNDGKCNFQASHTCPREYTMMVCSMCDEKRKPTEEEMQLILSNDTKN